MRPGCRSASFIVAGDTVEFSAQGLDEFAAALIELVGLAGEISQGTPFATVSKMAEERVGWSFRRRDGCRGGCSGIRGCWFGVVIQIGDLAREVVDLAGKALVSLVLAALMFASTVEKEEFLFVEASFSFTSNERRWAGGRVRFSLVHQLLDQRIGPRAHVAACVDAGSRLPRPKGILPVQRIAARSPQPRNLKPLRKAFRAVPLYAVVIDHFARACWRSTVRARRRRPCHWTKLLEVAQHILLEGADRFGGCHAAADKREGHQQYVVNACSTFSAK